MSSSCYIQGIILSMFLPELFMMFNVAHNTFPEVLPSLSSNFVTFSSLFAYDSNYSFSFPTVDPLPSLHLKLLLLLRVPSILELFSSMIHLDDLMHLHDFIHHNFNISYLQLLLQNIILNSLSHNSTISFK